MPNIFKGIKMSTVTANSGGPGSSITLDPEIVSMRDRYLKALEGKPFDEMNLLIQKQLETEEEDIKSIALKDEKIKKYVSDSEIKKLIYVPGKLINIVL